mgnify:CR=1 FL=1
MDFGGVGRRAPTPQRLGLGGQRGAFAEALTQTPKQMEGPFYPVDLPLDTDNDLIILNNGVTPAVGEIAWLSGRILDEHGDPVRNALVEIWQADNNGAYIHTKTGNAAKRDGNFQGFGRFLTGSNGEYVFRTIKPVPYKPRTPHIHLAVRIKGKKELITQCYIQGHELNENDMVYKAIKDPKQRANVTLGFDPLKGSKAGELAARHGTIVLAKGGHGSGDEVIDRIVSSSGQIARSPANMRAWYTAVHSRS